MVISCSINNCIISSVQRLTWILAGESENAPIKVVALWIVNQIDQFWCLLSYKGGENVFKANYETNKNEAGKKWGLK